MKVNGLASAFQKRKVLDALTYDEPETTHALQRTIRGAVKVAGIVDMADPEFYIEIVDDKENQQHMHLWIGEKGQTSTLMNTEDTHTIYTVSEKETEQLIELVESHFD